MIQQTLGFVSPIIGESRTLSSDHVWWATVVRFRKSITGVLLTVLLLLLGGHLVLVVNAQSRVDWSEPINLSQSINGSYHPAIVVDGYGNIHVFWSENMGGNSFESSDLEEDGDTIMYQRWDGESWTNPLDILDVPNDKLADFVAATVDDSNQLHLVWTGLTDIYYSTAPAIEAYSAKAWSAPQLIALSARTRYEADVGVDSQGVVHIVYAGGGNEPGVFHMKRSPDQSSWNIPVLISDSLGQNEVAYKDVRMIIDSQDRLHVVWSTANDNKYSQAVFYTNSDRGGKTWAAPTLMADSSIDTGFIGFPYLLAYGDEDLLLIHVDQSNIGRIEHTSNNGGTTWGKPQFILPEMEGVNGFIIPLIDGADNLHLIINMRPTVNQRVGIYYAPRNGMDWSPITPIATDAPFGPSAHYTDAVVRLDNEIHVVWTQLDGGEIWYVRGLIEDIPQALPLSLPGTVIEEVPATPLPASAIISPTVRPTLLPTQKTEKVTTDSLLTSILAPLGVSLLFVLLVALVTIRQH